ncbi:hypothetical protein CPC08DRAFT_823074 [Agrocybe pediades]|nr:hypothetical protein CPC08DRAFT_823074 [Agrocybe pediades]
MFSRSTSYVPSTNYRAPSTSAAASTPRPRGSATIDVDIDAETSALIARLALEDLEESYPNRKGKSRFDAPLTDQDVAHKLQVEHYQQMLMAAEDAILAKSITGAVQTDETYLTALIIAEEAAAQDRRAAEMLSRDERLPERTAAQVRVEQRSFVMHPPPPPPPPPPPVISIQDDDADDDDSEDEIASDLISNYSDSDLDTLYGDYDKRTSNVSAGKMPAARPRTVDCTICTDSIRSDRALHTPCNHYYCRDCVVALVESFTRDESLFPLRCCGQPIPIKDVAPFINSTLQREFNEKHAEFSIPSQNRVYCVSPQCSKFLGSSEGRYKAIFPWIYCPDCGTGTCPKCKQAEHEGRPCADNTALAEVRAMASKEGWQTCPGCHAIVELSIGCYHMTCRCRAEFCYLCAVPWKNCTCVQWDEAHLLATAQQRVENELGPRAARRTAPNVFETMLRDVAQNLRTNHECFRHNWKYRDGGGRCETCNFLLPKFLLLCRNCAMLACVRCTRNRLSTTGFQNNLNNLNPWSSGW